MTSDNSPSVGEHFIHPGEGQQEKTTTSSNKGDLQKREVHYPLKEKPADIPVPPPLLSESSQTSLNGRSHEAKTLTPEQKDAQDKAIKKMKAASNKVPATPMPFDRQLQMAGNAMRLKTISKHIENGSIATHKDYELQKLSQKKTQNPVAKMGGVLFIPKDLLKDRLKENDALSLKGVKSYYNKDELLNDLQIKMNLMNLAKENGEEKDSILTVINKVKACPDQYLETSQLRVGWLKLMDLKTYVSSTEFIAANNNEQVAQELIEQIAKSAKMAARKFVFKTGIENIRELLAGKLIASLGLSKPLVPKSEVKLKGATFKNVKNPEGIASVFLAGTLYQTVLWDSFIKAKKEFAREEYSCDKKTLQTRNQVKKIQTELKSRIDKHLYENEELNNELKKFSIFNWKGKAKINAQLAHNKMLIKACKEDLKKINSELKDLNNSLPEDFIRAEITYEGAKEDIMALGGNNQISQHVLTDLLFCSSDSHGNQYIFIDGEILNIDFARFMAPHEAVIKDEGTQQRVFLVLKSFFLDHPQSERPFSQQDINTILSWDLDQIEREWRKDGLIGEEAKFDEYEKKLKSLRDEYIGLDKLNYHALKKKCNENHINAIGKGVGWMKKKLGLKVYGEIEKIRKESFCQVHPKAFQNFKIRADALQKYLEDCKQKKVPPSLKGALPYMYPLAMPFMKVIERLVTNPSARFGQLSLNDILDHAKKNDSASPEEIKAMEDALAVYQTNAPPVTSLMSAMNVGLE